MLISGISIHALVKRATYAKIYACNARKNFNPRPRKEGDRRGMTGSTHTTSFQSNASWDKIFISIHALVKRATEPPVNTKDLESNFNPRPRKEGDDAFIVDGYIYHFISIHALVKRATGLADSSNGSKGDFNPRPRKEGDRKRIFPYL